VRSLALRPWLYQITLNVARNRARRKRPRFLPLEGQDGEPHEPVDDERTRPESMAARNEDEAELGAQVASLPPRYRAAVVLRHVEGLSYDEAASALGQPVGTVKSNVHRGLRLLRQAMGGPGGEL
jgi:RNA polymerase sigma-70 factor (ECF subfamily)